MFCKFREVSRKATAPAHAPYLRPVGNSPTIAATNLPGADLGRAATLQGCAPGMAHINFAELAGRFNPQKTIGTCSDHP